MLDISFLCMCVRRSGSKNIRSESTSYGLENRVFTEVEKEAGVEMDPTTCDVFRVCKITTCVVLSQDCSRPKI